MGTKSNVILKFAGFFELLFGVVSIALMLWVLSAGDTAKDLVANVGLSSDVANKALWQIVIVYGNAGLKIIGGLVALTIGRKAKHYKVCMVFGILLIVFGFLTVYQAETNVLGYIMYLGVPIVYLLGAALSKKN